MDGKIMEERLDDEVEKKELRCYVVRKLCSGIEEYEASPRIRMDMDLTTLEKKLVSNGLTEVFVNGPQLTLLLEDIETTAKIYPSGVMQILSGNKKDCDRACDIIYPIIMKFNAEQGSGKGTSQFKKN